jgi:hypothetical protein
MKAGNCAHSADTVHASHVAPAAAATADVPAEIHRQALPAGHRVVGLDAILWKGLHKQNERVAAAMSSLVQRSLQGTAYSGLEQLLESRVQV